MKIEAVNQKSGGSAESSMIVHDEKRQSLMLNYTYEYEIDLQRIKTERDVMAWACHLCQKSWMTTARVRAVIVRICEIKGFSPYGL